MKSMKFMKLNKESFPRLPLLRLETFARRAPLGCPYPDARRDEVLAGDADPAEKRDLQGFLASCRVDAVRRPRRFASAMSRADNAALTLAVRHRAEILLCDDRITRVMAETEGIRPLGTIGLLLRAMRQSFLRPLETKDLVDLLIRCHGFRIGVELYQAVLAEIESSNQ